MKDALKMAGYGFAFLWAATACTQAAPPPTPSSKLPLSQPSPREAAPTPTPALDLQQELRGVEFNINDWNTNFENRTVRLTEFSGGGPTKDGIPAINKPKFETVEEASKWLNDREPVQVVSINGDDRAYPQQILMWHEIVNDTVGGEPIIITY